MKHYLFLLLISFSINYYSQLTFTNLEHNHETKIFESSLFKSNKNAKTSSLIPIYDSIDYFPVNSGNGQFPSKTNKTVGFTYDANNNNTQQIDQYYYPSWENTYRRAMTFDSNSNLTNSMIQDWISGAWVNYSQEVNTFDIHNNLSTSIYQTWNSGAWKNNSEQVFTYDSNNNLINKTTYVWNGSSWGISAQYLYTYDSNNNQTTHIYQNWNGSSWNNNNQSFSTYDSNNHRILYVSQIWNGTSWDNDKKMTSTYNVNNLTDSLRQYWAASQWLNTTKQMNTYDVNNNRTLSLNLNWNGSSWVNMNQYLMTYDASGNNLSNFYQTWVSNNWSTATKIKYTYDADNFMKTKVRLNYNTFGFLGNGDSANYYFHTVVGLNELSKKENTITLYPNPSKGVVTIKSSKKIITIEVFNNLGVLVSKPDFKDDHTIDLSDLSKGLYFIKMSDNNVISTKPMIIE